LWGRRQAVAGADIGACGALGRVHCKGGCGYYGSRSQSRVLARPTTEARSAAAGPKPATPSGELTCTSYDPYIPRPHRDQTAPEASQAGCPPSDRSHVDVIRTLIWMTARQARGATSQSTETPPRGGADTASATAARTTSPAAQSEAVSASGKGGSPHAPDPGRVPPSPIRNSIWRWITAAAVLITILITMFVAVQLIGVVQSALGAVLTVVLYVLFGAVIAFITLQRGLDVDDVVEAARSFTGARWRKSGSAWLADEAPVLAIEPRPVPAVVATEDGEPAATILTGTADGGPSSAPLPTGEDGEPAGTIREGTADGGQFPAPSATGEDGEPNATTRPDTADGGPFPAPSATGEDGEPNATTRPDTADGGPFPAPPAAREEGDPPVPILIAGDDGEPYWRWPI
jgi:hypothetical protein